LPGSTQDAVGGVAQLEDIAGDAFHGEVFVDAADVQACGSSNTL
jgi:hypothetical protein